MSLTYLWFQIDQLPLFSRVIGAAGLLGMIVWALSFPLLLIRRLILRIEKLRGKYREWLAIKLNQMRASHPWCFFWASGLLQDFNGRAHALILAHQSEAASHCLSRSTENHRLGQEALLKLRISHSLNARIYAIKVLALLQPKGAWMAIAPYLKRAENPEFFHAAQALLKIDTLKALQTIIRMGMKHPAVNRQMMGQLIEGIAPKIVEQAFIDLLVEGGSGGESRLIALMPFLGVGGRLMPLRSYLPMHNRVAWLTMAIRLVNNSSQLPLVRPYLDHPDSVIRFYAALALGQCGEPIDLPALKRMMFRESPSVRRAATSAYISIMGRLAASSVPEQEAIA